MSKSAKIAVTTFDDYILYICVKIFHVKTADVLNCRRLKVQVLKVPAYFTEYCWKSYELTRLQMNTVKQQAATTVRVSEPTLNPFRSPIRKHDLQSSVPAFSNAIIFHLQYRHC